MREGEGEGRTDSLLVVWDEMNKEQDKSLFFQIRMEMN